MQFLKIFASVLPIGLAVDYIWIGLVARNFYRKHLGALDVRLVPALIVYILLVSALIVFVLPKSDSWQTALVYGGIFGLASYGIYDFTNLATLQQWTWKLAIVDMAWGGFLCAFLSFVIFKLHSFYS